MVDKAVLAAKLAAIRDAVARVRDVLPQSAEAFRNDRTTREIVTLNLFVALQELIALAAHWVADEGWAVPQSYAETFTVLGDRNVIDRGLALRLRGTAGLRNLIAHQYGVLNVDRIFAIASGELDDMLAFCRQLAERAEASGSAESDRSPS
jgi:uncharacterized protein YutE (UPF0331/DUF86 family)